MNDFSKTGLLQQKLKRHKIACTIEEDKVIIGKAKKDYLKLIFVISMFLFGIGLLYFILFFDMYVSFKLKIYIIPFVAIMIGMYYLNRLNAIKKLNQSYKILVDNSLIILENDNKILLDSNNIKEFKYTVEEKIMINGVVQKLIKLFYRNNEFNDDCVYQGKLFLIDENDEKHLVIGIEDKSEQFIDEDIVWLAEYLNDYLLENTT